MAGTAVLQSLAGNAATSQEHWPGALDVLRTDPWLWLGVLTVLGVAAAVLSWWQDRPGVTGHEPPAPPAVPGWVVDRGESDRVVAAVCARNRAVGITTGLKGAGGFGKTTMAQVVCADRRVQRRFRGRVYVITVGRDVRGRAAVTAKVAEATRFITGNNETFEDPALAGAHLGRLLDQRPPVLLVLDDVWEDEQLAPFLIGGSSCVRLVTTRNSGVLPENAEQITVDRMSDAQARAVLTRGLQPELPEASIDSLVRATGGWALLLRMVNQFIAAQRETGMEPARAAAQIMQRLGELGPTGADLGTPLDLDDPDRRNRAVRASIRAATGLLPQGAEERFTELGIFAEDEEIPLHLIVDLWQATAGLDETETRRLCGRMAGLSLLTFSTATPGGALTLHDVIRDYLRAELGSRLPAVNAALLDALAQRLPETAAVQEGRPVREWWQVTDGYLLDHLIAHLTDAERSEEAEAVAGDLRWISARLHQRGSTAPLLDLGHLDTHTALALAADLTRAAHLLTPTEPAHCLDAILHGRLHALPRWHDRIGDLPLTAPALVDRWPSPDLPHPALSRVLTEHTETVTAAAISPDGTWLATSGDDDTVRIWDPATGRRLRTLVGHTELVTAVAVGPDGTWLATTSRDETVRIWDPATGEEIHTLTGHTDSVFVLAVSPDGTWLATSGDDSTVRVWDPVAGRLLRTLSGHTARVTAVEISPDGAWLATSGCDETVRIWDPATGEEIHTIHTPTGERDFGVYFAISDAIAVGPDSRWLATGGDEGTVCIWDAASGEQLRTLSGHTNRVTAIAVSPDGTWLATTSWDGSARVWDFATGRSKTARVWRPTSNEYARDVDRRANLADIAVSQDGTWFAFGGDDTTVRIWSPIPGGQVRALSGHTADVTAVAISPDGSWLATTGEDKTVRIWNTSAVEQAPARTERTETVAEVAVSPDSTWLATAGFDETVRVWNAATGELLHTLTGHTDWVKAIAVSPDGTWLATTSRDETVRIWNPATGEQIRALTGHSEFVLAVAISPDGSWLATGDHGGTVCVWDAATGELLHTLTEHDRLVDPVAISPDGVWLATNDVMNVLIWNPVTGERLRTLTRDPDPGVGLVVSPDGTWLATSDGDATVCVWDAATGELLHTLTGPTDETIAVSPDGTWLATSGDDGTVRVWDPVAGRLLRTLSGHSARVTAFAISLDGAWLATTSEDRTVRIWNPATGEVAAMTRLDGTTFACEWAPDRRSLFVGARAGLHGFDFRPPDPNQ